MLESVSSPDTTARRRAMAAFARPPATNSPPRSPPTAAADAVDLRRPEAGLVMVRGRIGGDGAAFNLGEASVSRASVRLASGTVGHAYRLGRDNRRGPARRDRRCALAGRGDARRHRADLVGPVERRLSDARDLASRRAAATRVDFFTMVRGDPEG